MGGKLNIVIENFEQVTRTRVYVNQILIVSLFTRSFTLKTIMSFTSLIPLSNSWQLSLLRQSLIRSKIVSLLFKRAQITNGKPNFSLQSLVQLFKSFMSSAPSDTIAYSVVSGAKDPESRRFGSEILLHCAFYFYFSMRRT